MAVMLGRLDAKLPWKVFLDQTCGDLYDEARALKLEGPPGAGNSTPGFNGLSRYLKVHVIKPNGNEVKLTMPARVIDNLKEVIDRSVMESIQRQKIDLDQVAAKARRKGYAPHTVFEVEDPERKVKVWLE